MTWPDSTKYVGNFEDNLFNGYGVYTKKDGTISKGMWKDGGLVTPDGPETDDVESEVSSSDCNSLKVESDKQTKWNTSNLSSGKVIIGLKNQGPIVKYIQCLLNGKNKELSLGLSDLTVDGVFGSQTKKMVIKFQEKNGLSSDGVVGKDTFLKLV
jgi:peptidoglycan hydrolase-like protein with peptidoglycan-binding domain